ncbi:MAG: hypothetical protein KJZ65_10885 [Phycisphaerales bacterium]|nr:hypothetical protein [Phycisphaerales bacterium]
MHFSLIDRVLSRNENGATTLKHVSSAEEYLQDHFPTYPVLPGVMMLEAMIQAARSTLPPEPPMVLARVGALKYGSFVRPGDSILVQVTRHATSPDGISDFRGEVRLVAPGVPFDSADLPKAAAGKFSLRPVRDWPGASPDMGSGTHRA